MERSDHEASSRAARGSLFRQGCGWLRHGTFWEAFVIDTQKTKRLRMRVLKWEAWRPLPASPAPLLSRLHPPPPPGVSVWCWETLLLQLHIVFNCTPQDTHEQEPIRRVLELMQSGGVMLRCSETVELKRRWHVFNYWTAAQFTIQCCFSCLTQGAGVKPEEPGWFHGASLSYFEDDYWFVCVRFVPFIYFTEVGISPTRSLMRI